MSVSETIRGTVFWGLDFIKGSPVADHYKDIEQAFSKPERAEKLSKERLQNILKHATATAKFYKKNAGAEKLSDFAVIEKQTIKENYEAFISDTYDKCKLVKTTTSGSYGTPFTFFLTKQKRARQQAEVIFFNEWAGYEVGMRYSQFRVHPRSKLLLWMQNGMLMNPSVVDESWLREKRELLKKGKIRFIIAYPTALQPLAEYCREQGDGPDDFHLEGIVSGAEPLLDYVRSTLEGVFGCPVLDRYSSNELGVVSHECLAGRRHHINLTSHKVEILKINSDQPAEAGELGRVVITDYFSHAMPLIRYDTGDLACWSNQGCSCGLETPVIAKISGRLMEMIYTPNGKMINPLAIDREPKDLNDIIQFQFIQKSRDNYLVKLMVKKSFSQEDVLKQRYQTLLGVDAYLEFEYVDAIEPLPSGKRPYIVNEYTKK
jgi:phenylacetate-CoA ligase